MNIQQFKLVPAEVLAVDSTLSTSFPPYSQLLQQQNLKLKRMYFENYVFILKQNDPFFQIE